MLSPVIAGQGRGFPDIGQAAANSAIARHNERRDRVKGLYVLTDPDLAPDRTPVQIAKAALAGGAKIIQLRDKRMPASQLIPVAREIRELADAVGALFIVNDRVDIALAADAHGVHLGPDDMAPADARRVLRPEQLVGVSVGTVEEARSAKAHASYLAVGAIYFTKTKTDAGHPVGLQRIMDIRSAVPNMPLVAIGGIDGSNIGSVRKAGANAAAVISAVVSAPDMQEAVRDLVKALGLEEVSPI
jgi:thiamine-phosphate pyrophosphorylase